MANCKYVLGNLTFSTLKELKAYLNKGDSVFTVDGVADTLFDDQLTAKQFFDLKRSFNDDITLITDTKDYILQEFSALMEYKGVDNKKPTIIRRREEIFQDLWRELLDDPEFIERRLENSEHYLKDLKDAKDLRTPSERLEKVLTNLKRPSVFKDVLTTLYPTLKMTIENDEIIFKYGTVSEEAIRDEREDNNEPLAEGFNNKEENKGNQRNQWEVEGDDVSPTTRLSAAVKDFLYSITVKTKDSKGVTIFRKVDTGSVFTILLNAFNNITHNRRITEEGTSSTGIWEDIDIIKQELEKIKGSAITDNESNKFHSIYNTLKKIWESAYYEPKTDIAKQFKMAYVGDNRNGRLSIKYLPNLYERQVEVTSSDIIAYEIKRALGELDMLLKEDGTFTDEYIDLVNMYNALEATETLNSMFSIFNSHRKKNPYMLKTKSTFKPADNEAGFTIVKSFKNTRFIGNIKLLQESDRMFGAVMDNREALLAIDLGYLGTFTADTLYTDIPEFKYDKCKGILKVLEDKKILDLSGGGYEQHNEAVIKTALKEILFYLNRTYKTGLEGDALEEAIADLPNQIISSLKDLADLKKVNRMSEISSYRGGDKNLRWFWTLSSNAVSYLMPTFQDIQGRREFDYYGYAYNVFNSENTASKKIYEMIDPDSTSDVRDKSGRFSISPTEERGKNRDERLFINNFLTNYHEKKDIILQTYTPSDSKQFVEYRVEALKHYEYDEVITLAFEQRIAWLKLNRELEINNSSERLDLNRHIYDIPNEHFTITPKQFNDILWQYIESEPVSRLDFTDIPKLSAYIKELHTYLEAKAEESFNNTILKNRVKIPSQILTIAYSLSGGNVITEKEYESLYKAMGYSMTMKEAEERGYDKVIQDEVKAKLLKTLIEEGNDLWSKEQRELYKAVMFPLFKAFWYNNYLLGSDLNQLAAGPLETYKDSYDEIKRGSMVHGLGTKARVHSKTGLKTFYDVLVLEDFVVSLEENEDTEFNFLSRFLNLNGLQGESSDAQSFAIPHRMKNLRKGFSGYANIGSTIKNMFSGFSKNGLRVGVKTSTVELTDDNIKGDKIRRGLRKYMEFSRLSKQQGTLPQSLLSLIAVLDTSTYSGQAKNLQRENISAREAAETIFDLLFEPNQSIPTDELNKIKVLYEEFLDFSEQTGAMFHEAVFESAVKFGKPINVTRITEQPNGELKIESINRKTKEVSQDVSLSSLTLRNEDYKIQSNPRKNPFENTKVTLLNQVIFQLVSKPESSVFERAAKVYMLLSNIHKLGITASNIELYSNPTGLTDESQLKSLINKLMSSLSGVKGQEHLVGMLAGFKNNPLAILNHPTVVNKAAETFISIHKKNTVRKKAPGGGFVLQTADLMEKKNQPKFIFETKDGKKYESTDPRLKKVLKENIKTYYAECLIPKAFLKQFPSGLFSGLTEQQIIRKLEDLGLNFVGFRIPSTGLHSTIPLKIKGFTKSETEDNFIVVPREIVILHGSDFDVDKLYVMGRHVMKENLSLPYTHNGRTYTIDMYSKLPIHIEAIQNEDGIFTIRERSYDKNKFESYEDYLIQDILPKILRSIQDEQERNVYKKNRIYTNEHISEILGFMQDVYHMEVQRNVYDIITSPDAMEAMFTPINVDIVNEVADIRTAAHYLVNVELKNTGRLELTYPSYRGQWLKDNKIDEGAVTDKIERAILNEWKKVITPIIIKPAKDLNAYGDQSNFFHDNVLALESVGIFASGYKSIANFIMAASKFEEGKAKRGLPKLSSPLTWMGGRKIETFSDHITYTKAIQIKDDDSRSLTVEATEEEEESVQMLDTTSYEQTDILINLALDHVKLQALNFFGIDKSVSSLSVILTHFGIPLEEISLLVNQPAINLYKEIGSISKVEKILTDMLVGKDKKYPTMEDLKKAIKEEAESNAMIILKDGKKVKESLGLGRREDLEFFYKKTIEDIEDTSDYLLKQLILLRKFKRFSNLNDIYYRMGRIGGVVSDLPRSMEDLYNLKNTYEEFMDDVRLADATREVKPEFERTSYGRFSNINIDNIPHVKQAMNNVIHMLNMSDKIFIKYNKRMMQVFYDNVLELLKSYGISEEEMLGSFIADRADTEEEKMEINSLMIDQISQKEESERTEGENLLLEEQQRIQTLIKEKMNKVHEDTFFPFNKNAILQVKAGDENIMMIPDSMNTRQQLGNTYTVLSSFIENFLVYIVNSTRINSSFLNVEMSSLKEAPIEKVTSREGEEKKVKYIYGNEAWIEKFINGSKDFGFNLLDKSGKKVFIRVLGIREIIKEQEIKDDPAYRIFDLVYPKTDNKKLNFFRGSIMDELEMLKFDRYFSDAYDLPIYELEREAEEGKIEKVRMTVREVAEHFGFNLPYLNHFQANMVKYTILVENSKFGSLRISKNISAEFIRPILNQQIKRLSAITVYGKSLTIGKKKLNRDVSFDIHNFVESFAYKNFVNYTETLKYKVHSRIKRQGRKVVNGVLRLESGKVFYDAHLTYDKSKTPKKVIAYQNKVFVLVHQMYQATKGLDGVTRIDREKIEAYYQEISKASETNYFYNDLNNLFSFEDKYSGSYNFNINNMVRASIPRIAVTKEMITFGNNNTISLTIPRSEWNKYGENTIVKNDSVRIHYISDTLSELGQDFRVTDIGKAPEEGVIKVQLSLLDTSTNEDKRNLLKNFFDSIQDFEKPLLTLTEFMNRLDIWIREQIQDWEGYRDNRQVRGLVESFYKDFLKENEEAPIELSDFIQTNERVKKFISSEKGRAINNNSIKEYVSTTDANTPIPYVSIATLKKIKFAKREEITSSAVRGNEDTLYVLFETDIMREELTALQDLLYTNKNLYIIRTTTGLLSRGRALRETDEYENYITQQTIELNGLMNTAIYKNVIFADRLYAKKSKLGKVIVLNEERKEILEDALLNVGVKKKYSGKMVKATVLSEDGSFIGENLSIAAQDDIRQRDAELIKDLESNDLTIEEKEELIINTLACKI